MPRTFVCGARAAARHWCEHNGVPFRSSTTRIITPRDPSCGRGVRFAPEDRVVFVGDADWRHLEAVLIPAGLGSVVTPEFAR